MDNPLTSFFDQFSVRYQAVVAICALIFFLRALSSTVPDASNFDLVLDTLWLPFHLRLPLFWKVSVAGNYRTFYVGVIRMSERHYCPPPYGR